MPKPEIGTGHEHVEMLTRAGHERIAHEHAHHAGEFDSPALNVSGDWNDVTESGIYRGSGMTNQTPYKAHSWQYTQVIRHNSDYIVQMAFDFYHAGWSAGSGAVSARVMYAGVWRPWSLVGGDDSGWQEMTSFLNGATAYQGGLGNSWTPRYRKKNGIVYLQGLVNTNTTATSIHVTTLPAGYRPGTGTSMFLQATSGSQHRRMDINFDGAVVFRESPAYTTGWHSIGCWFPAEN